MGQPDYEAVLTSMRLADGTVWPMPITLDVSDEFAEGVTVGDTVALRDIEGFMLAALHVEDLWRPDLEREAELVFDSSDPDHPGVGYLVNQTAPVYLGGTIEGIQAPIHYDFQRLRRTPAEVRAEFSKQGWTKVVAFQTRNPMHRAHVELTMRAA
jgi:sulfate adenylyltransferase